MSKENKNIENNQEENQNKCEDKKIVELKPNLRTLPITTLKATPAATHIRVRAEMIISMTLPAMTPTSTI